jgi:hypothetical protein
MVYLNSVFWDVKQQPTLHTIPEDDRIQLSFISTVHHQPIYPLCSDTLNIHNKVVTVKVDPRNVMGHTHTLNYFNLFTLNTDLNIQHGV